MTVSGTDQTILVTGIDTIRHKNLYQLAGLAKYGFRFIVITSDQTETTRSLTRDYAHLDIRIAQPPHRWWDILRHTFKALLCDKITLVELYPYSLLGFLLAILVKLARKPLLLIARGPQWTYLTGRMPLWRRIWFRLTYLLADGVLYKETYMRYLMDVWRIRQTWLLPNAIKLPKKERKQRYPGCHFVYLNSINLVRHPEVAVEAFLELCEERQLKQDSPFHMTIAGFRGDKANPKVAVKEAKLREMIAGRDVPVHYQPWMNKPAELLNRADVFLLPADVVYVNYALLEAMGRGLPAMVQNAPSAEEVVTDGMDGFILPLEKDAWKAKMTLLMDDIELRARMGTAARKKVTEHFSLEPHLAEYKRIYDQIIKYSKR